MATHVDSASDARTVNNSVRHTYRVLNDSEKAQMQEVKDLGAALIEKLHEIRRLDPDWMAFSVPRDLQLAQDHVEDAVMRAVRHITS